MTRRSPRSPLQELAAIPGTLLVVFWTPLAGLFSLWQRSLQALQLGRVFRRLGLPLWTLIGIGAAGWWFDNAAVLLEIAIAQFSGAEPWRWQPYLAPSILFLLPFVVVGRSPWRYAGGGSSKLGDSWQGRSNRRASGA
ncbi:MAG: hypothetical protein HC910_17120 [Spirulinaceae cyanobacterium SM2_1_0]|nr:hypothetical protein [Spirulinaceae cyanobacterium SM2_1_0]